LVARARDLLRASGRISLRLGGQGQSGLKGGGAQGKPEERVHEYLFLM
jgi:hypothetical protein